MRFKMTATALVAGSLLGVAAYSVASQPSQVQAKASYRVQITKNAYVYTSKGKKTKTVYKRRKVLTAYRIRKIHGKYYYDLGHGKYIRTSYAKKYYYRTYKQTKKITRTIKLYQPKGKKYVYQNAYVKRTVKQNTKTWKKTYGKWSTATWQAYITPAVAGYTASTQQVNAETVYSWTKNKTVKIRYKKNAKKQTPKSNTPAKQNSSSTTQGNSTSNNSQQSENNSSSQNTSTTQPSNNDSSTNNSSTNKITGNLWNASKEQLVDEGILQVINELRTQVGLPSVTLNNQFKSILVKRGEDRAKAGRTRGEWGHDYEGWKNTTDIIGQQTGLNVLEGLDYGEIYTDRSDEQQIKDIVTKFRNDMVAEKEDYEAIVVNHTRTKCLNPAGTFGHYSTLINKPEDGTNLDTANAGFSNSTITQFAIGTGVYYKDVNEANDYGMMACVVFDALAKY